MKCLFLMLFMLIPATGFCQDEDRIGATAHAHVEVPAINTVLQFKEEIEPDAIIMEGRILPDNSQTTEDEFFTKGFCNIKADRKITANSVFRLISYDLGSNWDGHGPEVKALVLSNSEMTVKLSCRLGFRFIKRFRMPKMNNSPQNIRSVMQTLLELQ